MRDAGGPGLIQQGSVDLTIRSCQIWVLACVAFLAATPSAVLTQRRFDERSVKATYLLHFAQFVEWPDDPAADPQAPFVIGILGVDPFGRTIDDIVDGETVNGRPLRIARFRGVEDVTACHILFVDSAGSASQGEVLAALKGRPILTIGDTDGFAASGGIIRFITDRNRVRIRVNVAAAQEAGLIISARVLRIAELVGTDEVR